MKKHQLFLAVIFLFFQDNFIIAQNTEFTPDNFPRQATELNHALNNIRRGDMLYYKRMYFDAIDFYIKANRFNPDNAVLNYKIGKCYLFTIDKVQALTFLLKAYQLNSSVEDDILFLIARGYHITHNFDNAIEYYREYKNLLSLSELTIEGKIIDKHIQECNYGKEFILTPSRVFIDNIGQNINSLYPEYNPIVNADESMLIFTSRRPDGTSSKRDPADQGYFEDIYISYRGKDGEWQKPVNPGRPMNNRNHNAAAGLSPDGQQLFVYMSKGGGTFILADKTELNGPSLKISQKLIPDITNHQYLFLLMSAQCIFQLTDPEALVAEISMFHIRMTRANGKNQKYYLYL